MSRVEQTFCRSAPWRRFARHSVLPWALQGQVLAGDVLELGSGSGAMAQGIAVTYPGLTLTASDIDPAMVQAAKRRLRDFPNVAVEIADVTNLPFPAESFDAVVSFLMLHHVVDWEVAVHEAARVLRPGGRFIGYDLADTWAARAGHVLDRSPHRMLHRGALAPTLSEARFGDIEVRSTLGGLTFSFCARRGDEEDLTSESAGDLED